jgi:aminomethyltransferase
LGYVPMALKEVGSQIHIQIRNKIVPAMVVKLPFYKK